MLEELIDRRVHALRRNLTRNVPDSRIYPVQLRDATYAGVSFLLIAGTLWLVALRSTEKKPALDNEMAVLDLNSDIEPNDHQPTTLNSIPDLQKHSASPTFSENAELVKEASPVSVLEKRHGHDEGESPYKSTHARKFSAKWVDPGENQIQTSEKIAKVEPAKTLNQSKIEPVKVEQKPAVVLPEVVKPEIIKQDSNVADDGFKLTKNKFYKPEQTKDDPKVPAGNKVEIANPSLSSKESIDEKAADPIARNPVDKVVSPNSEVASAKPVIPGIEPKLFDTQKHESGTRDESAAAVAKSNISKSNEKLDEQPKSTARIAKSKNNTDKIDRDNSQVFAKNTAVPSAEHSLRMLSPELIWWKAPVRSSIIVSESSCPIQLDSLLSDALVNSPTIIAISQEPLIEQQEVVRAESQFDPEVFMRTQFDSRNDPVGNTLTVGPGESFLKDNIWNGHAGLRKKLASGGSLDVKQELGFQNSNSTFFQPQDQGTSTLSLNFSQPLLRGGGRLYNESRIFLAQSISDTAVERYQTELQDELLKVAEAYWKLYYFRCRLLQIRNNIDRGEKVLKRLEDRAKLDSIPSQIARARAAVQSRRSQVANAERDVRNAETTIRKLLGTPDWASQYHVEMLPVDHPRYDHCDLPVESVVDMALEQRPEVKQALQRARSASIQLDISRNELLPELNMLLGSYVSALEGDSGVLPAYGNQFGNRPGYYAGFEFRLPYRNREANSVYRQRVLNMQKITAEVEVAVQNVVADAQVSLRQVNSAHETLGSTISAIEAARADLEYQQRRWESFAIIEGDFAEGQNPATLLDQLLESQQRLTNEELNFSRAEFDFKVAQYYLKKSMGTLLQAVSLEQATLNEATLEQSEQVEHQAGEVYPQPVIPLRTPYDTGVTKEK